MERVHGVNPWLRRICCGWQPEQIVDIPDPKIVEEIAEVSKFLFVCNSVLNLYSEEIKCFRHELV